MLMSHQISRAHIPAVPEVRPSCCQQHWQKFIALLFWLLLMNDDQWYPWHHKQSSFDVLQQIIALLQFTIFSSLLFIAFYAIRPLILFPATVLTLGTGMVFSPVLGATYTIIGSTASALLAFFVGRMFGADLLIGKWSAGMMHDYAERLRQNNVETVLSMRFAMLRYDRVNYLCDMLRIDWRAYLLATATGSLPGTIVIVLAASSITGDVSQGVPSFDPRVFAVSVAVLMASLVISRTVTWREQRPTQQ